jgi:hypothetical protein
VRFWDSSAIVPLLVTQPASAQAGQWLREDRSIAIWTLTPVELVSALRRLVREGTLDERVAREAEARAQEVAEASHVIVDVESVKARAVRLLRVHALRAADALQLAAALEWAVGVPADRVFHTLDGRLALAAWREGFRVLPVPE